MNTVKLNSEELEVLNELESIGVFLNPKERREYRKEVCGPNVLSYQDITEDDFEAAFFRAKSALQKRGEKILRDLIRSK